MFHSLIVGVLVAESLHEEVLISKFQMIVLIIVFLDFRRHKALASLPQENLSFFRKSFRSLRFSFNFFQFLQLLVILN